MRLYRIWTLMIRPVSVWMDLNMLKNQINLLEADQM